MPNGGFGGNGINGGNGGPGPQFVGGNGVTGPGADFGSNGVGGNGFNGPTGGDGGGFPGGVPGGADDSDNAIDTGDSDDVNCDYLGTCYDGKHIYQSIIRFLNDVLFQFLFTAKTPGLLSMSAPTSPSVAEFMLWAGQRLAT